MAAGVFCGLWLALTFALGKWLVDRVLQTLAGLELGLV